MEITRDHGHASAFDPADASAAKAADGGEGEAATAALAANITSLATLLNRRLRDTLRAEDLSAAHWSVLKQVEKAGPVSVGAVAAALDMEETNAVRLAGQLSKLGYIGVDGNTQLETSPVGRAVMRRVEHNLRLQLDWLRGAVDPQELSVFQQVCKKFANVLDTRGPVARA